MPSPYSDVLINGTLAWEVDGPGRAAVLSVVLSSSGADAMVVWDASNWVLFTDEGDETFVFKGPDGGTFLEHEGDAVRARAIELLREVGLWEDPPVPWTVDSADLDESDEDLAAGALRVHDEPESL